MPKYMSGDELDQLVQSDPRIERGSPLPPRVRRKLDVVVDEDLEPEVVAFLQATKKVRTHSYRSGASDQELWDYARRRRAVLVTANVRDFWDDRRYPIQACPGLLVLTGRSAQEHIRALDHALTKSALLEDNARWSTCRDMKIKATPRGVMQTKRYYVDEGRIVVDDL